MKQAVASCAATPGAVVRISLEKLSKRYLRHWIFKDLQQDFSAPGCYALLGPNGSGKSTLLRILAGMQPATQGKVRYWLQDKELPMSAWFSQIAFCAPGMELPEELTLSEFLDFHFQFRKPLPGLTEKSILALTGLENAKDKPIADFSSGMKQRVKLVQAICSDSPVLMLDEPCTNLDDAGVRQYQDWISRFSAGRLLLVASNDAREYAFCEKQIILGSS